jgi:hypothetical protein
MPDFDDEYEEWLPPPYRPPVEWPSTSRRFGQVVALHAATIVIVGFAVLVGFSAATAGRLILCATPALGLSWLGFVAYLTASAAAPSGVPSEGGRLLVAGLDMLTAFATVFGVFIGVAVAFR